MIFVTAWTLVICTLVNGYLLGVMALFAAVVYPQFGAVEASAFPPLYAAFTARIAGPVVAFEFAALPRKEPWEGSFNLPACAAQAKPAAHRPLFTSLLLSVARPASTPLAAVHVLCAFAVLYFVITFGWHLPAHRALADGKNSPQALSPLLASQWTRTAVQLARVALLGWLGARAATSG